MNIFFIIRLSSIGLLAVISSIYFFTAKTEPIVWLIVFFIYGYVVAKRADRNIFLNGLLCGLINAIWVIVICVLKYPAFITHHAELSKWVHQLPEKVNPYYLFILLKGISAIISAVIPASFAYIISKIKVNFT